MTQPDTCVQCGGELAIHPVICNQPLQEFIHSVLLPYCPNPACPNYGLVTVGRSGVDNE